MGHSTTDTWTCIRCGTQLENAGGEVCPDCKTRIAPPATTITNGHDDYTINITEQTDDPDKTIRASRRKMSSLYTQAVALTQEKVLAANTPTERVSRLPGHELASLQSANTDVPQRTEQRVRTRNKKVSILSTTSVVCLVLLCGLLGYGAWQNIHDPHYLTLPQQKRAQIDQLLAQARASGMPETYLAPIIQQEQQIDSGLPWFSLSFYLQPGPAYAEQVTQYNKLQQQAPGIITKATQQLQARSQQDMQQFQIVLTRMTMQPMGNSNAFTQRFSADQLLLGSAHDPRDYLAISNDARASTNALNTMATIAQQLTTMKSMLDAMQLAHLNITILQNKYQQASQTFASVSDPNEIQRLHNTLSLQYQTLLSSAIKNYAAISKARLQNFAQQIKTLKNYGKKTGPYAQLLQSDTASVARAHTSQEKVASLQRIDSDSVSIQNELTQDEANAQVTQFHREVANWARSHPYHDTFDGKDYPSDAEYMAQGIGSILDADQASASTTEDFQALMTEAQNALFNLHLLEADSQDKTTYNQVHATDKQALDHYHLKNKQVLMISLSGQAMRLYQNGQLQRAFQVVTGSPMRPSLPGIWPVLDRKSPTTFVSKDPKGSPFWFAPTPIKYAILYHYGGDYIHDAYWRSTFGAGAQYPHQDTSGNTPFNYDGSHGCINMSESDMAWLYNHTSWQTMIVIY